MTEIQLQVHVQSTKIHQLTESQWPELLARRQWSNRLLSRIANSITDADLRSLSLPVCDIGLARRYVPAEFEGRVINDESAPLKLQMAVERAIRERLRDVRAISGFTWCDETSRYIALWIGQDEPELPAVLRDLPFFGMLRDNSGDIEGLADSV